MGYTHYWYRKDPEPADAYGRLALDAKRIFEQAEQEGIVLVHEYDRSTPPTANEGEIWFNGKGDDGHETFVWPAETPELRPYQTDTGEGSFTFCKTARKPYDAVVGALLIRAKLHYGASVAVSSDGWWDGDWDEPRAFYARTFGEAAPCPLEKEEE